MKILMQTRKHETMTDNNKQQLYVNQMYTSHISKILGGSFAYLELFREMNNITLQITSYSTLKVQHNRTSKQINFKMFPIIMFKILYTSK